MLHNGSGSMRRVLRLLIACAAAGVMVSAGVPGKVYADDDEAIDVKVMRSVMRGLGLKRGDEESIDYHERSPLVVPPSTALPRPEDSSLAERNPAWPDDPDIRRAKQAAKREQRVVDWNDEGRALRPSELNKGIPRDAGPTPSSDQAKTAEDSARVFRPSELGFKGFGNMRKLFGFAPQEETSTFVAEPKRTDLTQPPPGLLTPSSAQPYGVGKSRSTWGDLKPANPMDAAVGSSGEK